MMGGRLRARFEKHQRAYGFGRGFELLQQMQIERKREAGESEEEPGGEESHRITAFQF